MRNSTTAVTNMLNRYRQNNDDFQNEYRGSSNNYRNHHSKLEDLDQR